MEDVEDCFHFRMLFIKLRNVHGSLKAKELLKIVEESARFEDWKEKKKESYAILRRYEKTLDQSRNKCIYERQVSSRWIERVLML